MDEVFLKGVIESILNNPVELRLYWTQLQSGEFLLKKKLAGFVICYVDAFRFRNW